jgi:rhodanese-related sulfurtransferase
VLLIIAPCIAAADTVSVSDTGYKNVTVCEAKEMIDEGNVFILDVRTPAEFEAAHIEGTTLIPFKNVPAHDPVILTEDKLLKCRISEVPRDRPVIVYCLTGGRSLNASKLLVEKEYTNIYNMQGGIPAWIDARYPVVSTFVDELGLDHCIKNALNVKINRVLYYLEKGNDAKAEKELDKFICFVNATERAEKLNSNQANYSRLEAENIRHMM